MIHRDLPNFLTLCLAAVLPSILNPPPISTAHNDSYAACGADFHCGNLAAVGYPFWGGERPKICGDPRLQLVCENDTTTIDIHDVKYRVLEINLEMQVLRIARMDLSQNLCLQEFQNTTLDSDIFEYFDKCVNLIFFYGCPALPLPFEFDCAVKAAAERNVYVTPGVRELINPAVCYSSVMVPVPVTYESLLKFKDLRQLVSQGFGVRFKVDGGECGECASSGGSCGYDSGEKQFVCFCQDGSTPTSKRCAVRTHNPGSKAVTGLESGRKKKNAGRIAVGLSIGGAVLAGLGLGLLFFYCRHRRKLRHLPLAAQTPGALTKEIKSVSSSTPLSTHSSNFTQSIPSYPSSKSDIGRGSSYFGAKVFEYEELEQATDNFNPSRELGEGGFGTVYYGELPDGRTIAVKRLYENNFRRVEQFMNEVKILTQVTHPNLVQLYGCTSRRSRELLLVYEYVPNGTVADHIHGKRSNSGLLSWPVRLNIAIETAEALSYLHKSDIIHRDVKTNNILLCDKFHVKVADFGLSRLFPTDVTHVSTAPQGTPGYVDPEYYQIYQLTEQSDVYSFGVVLMELISSLLAVDITRHRHDINLSTMAINKIQNHALHEMVDPNLGFETDTTVRRMITQVAELAFQCLQQEREMRPSMEQVLQTLKGIQNDNTNGDHQEEVVDMLVDDDTGPLKGSDALSPPDV